MGKVEELIKQGATVIDIRSRERFKLEHAENSMNIPFDDIPNRLETLKAIQGPIVVCCSKGVLSEKVTCYLEISGVEAYNAGSWIVVQSIRKQYL